jgi:hypothetical protein
MDYEERLRRGVANVHDHLEKKIEMAILAEVACPPITGTGSIGQSKARPSPRP